MYRRILKPVVQFFTITRDQQGRVSPILPPYFYQRCTRLWDENLNSMQRSLFVHFIRKERKNEAKRKNGLFYLKRMDGWIRSKKCKFAFLEIYLGVFFFIFRARKRQPLWLFSLNIFTSEVKCFRDVISTLLWSDRNSKILLAECLFLKVAFYLDKE